MTYEHRHDHDHAPTESADEISEFGRLARLETRWHHVPDERSDTV